MDTSDNQYKKHEERLNEGITVLNKAIISNYTEVIYQDEEEFQVCLDNNHRKIIVIPKDNNTGITILEFDGTLVFYNNEISFRSYVNHRSDCLIEEYFKNQERKCFIVRVNDKDWLADSSYRIITKRGYYYMISERSFRRWDRYYTKDPVPTTELFRIGEGGWNKENKYGIIDEEGKEVVSCDYDLITFSSDWILAYKDESIGFLRSWEPYEPRISDSNYVDLNFHKTHNIKTDVYNRHGKRFLITQNGNPIDSPVISLNVVSFTCFPSGIIAKVTIIHNGSYKQLLVNGNGAVLTKELYDSITSYSGKIFKAIKNASSVWWDKRSFDVKAADGQVSYLEIDGDTLTLVDNPSLDSGPNESYNRETSLYSTEDIKQMYRDAFEDNSEAQWNID